MTKFKVYGPKWDFSYNSGTSKVIYPNKKDEFPDYNLIRNSFFFGFCCVCVVGGGGGCSDSDVQESTTYLYPVLLFALLVLIFFLVFIRQAGSIEGQVVEMGLTTTSLLNAEKFPVIVPNSLFSSQVNWQSPVFCWLFPRLNFDS